MKNIFFFLLLLSSGFTYGQADTSRFNMQGTPASKVGIRGYYAADSGFVSKPTDTLNSHVPLGTVRFDAQFRQYIFTGTRWLPVSGSSGLDTAAALSLITWTNLQGKPATFPPATHGHSTSDISGLQPSLDSKASLTALADTAANIRSSIVSGTGFDTSSLSARINQRVKYSDTAAMLVPYATKGNLTDSAQLLRGLIVASSVDTTSLSARINQRVKYSDTDTMLASYAKQQGLNDSAAALRLAIGSGGPVIDTTSLSNRINQRVKYIDTAAMLSAYTTKGNLKDSTSALRVLIASSIVDTSSLSNRIDSRLKHSDTSIMLSAYAKKSKVLIDSVALSNSINQRISGLTPNYLTLGSSSTTIASSSTINENNSGNISIGNTSRFEGTKGLNVSGIMGVSNLSGAPGGLSMYINPDGFAEIQSWNLGLAINYRGNPVGIGTSTPNTSYALHVNGKALTTQINSGSSNTLNGTNNHIISESSSISSGAAYSYIFGGYTNSITSSAYLSGIFGGSNTVGGTNCYAFGGANTIEGGNGNITVGGSSSVIFGSLATGNTIIGGRSAAVDNNKNYNILLGTYVYAQYSGCFLAGDSVGGGYLISDSHNQFKTRFKSYKLNLTNSITAFEIDGDGNNTILGWSKVGKEKYNPSTATVLSPLINEITTFYGSTPSVYNIPSAGSSFDGQYIEVENAGSATVTFTSTASDIGYPGTVSSTLAVPAGNTYRLVCRNMGGTYYWFRKQY